MTRGNGIGVMGSKHSDMSLTGKCSAITPNTPEREILARHVRDPLAVQKFIPY